MPGRDYTHAFALLDESLRDSAYLKTPLQQPSFESDDDAYAQANDSQPTTPRGNGTRLISQPFIHGPSSSFPPTPPPSSSIHLQRNLNIQGDNSVSYRSYDSSLTTPTNPQSLPTPETTPPRLQERLTSEFSGSFFGHSPNAESFKTAQEDQSSNGDCDSSNHSIVYHLQSNTTGSGSKATKSTDLQGLGMNVLANGHQTWPPLRHRADFSDFSMSGRAFDWGTENDDGNVDHSHVEKWDVEKMRNVTLRHKPKQRSEDNSIPLLMRGLSLRHDLDPRPQNSKDQRAAGELSPMSDDSSIIQNLFDLEMKRLSGTSVSSTIIEAVVIDHTPPPRKRKLRHVSKTESLREDSSPRLQQDSSTSEDTPERTEKPKTRNRYGFGPLQPLIAQPRSLRRRTDMIPLRPLTAPAEQTSTENLSKSCDQRRVVSDPLRISAVSMEDKTPPPPSVSPASFAAEDFQDAASTAPQDEVSPEAVDRDLFDYDFYNPPRMPGSFPVQTSDDDFVLGSENVKRESFAPSLGWSDNSLRHLASPRSMKSETTGYFEINEAAAVQFSSHTNNSLLVIHNSSSNEVLRRHTVANPGTTNPRAEEGNVITLETASPYESQDFTFDLDSPLQNPRVAPEPPIVSIIPPTPARELDAQDDDDSSTPTLTQQTSMLGRARRYSESFMQPITGSIRCTRHVVSRRRSQSARRSERDRLLHPDWRPKGHSMNYPGSEDQDTDSSYEDGTAQGRAYQDSSEKWRRMGSLRGFLIGNTLGLQRGPTNKRRHVVTLPANNQRKQPSRNARKLEHVSVRDSVKRSGSGRQVRRRAGARTTFRGWRDRMFEKGWGRERRRRDEKAANLKSNITWPNASTNDTPVDVNHDPQ